MFAANLLIGVAAARVVGNIAGGFAPHGLFAIRVTDKAGHEIDFLFAGGCPCVALM